MADPKFAIGTMALRIRSGAYPFDAGSHVHTRVPPHLPPPQMPIDRWHPIDAKPCSLDHSGLSGSLPHAPLSHHKSPLPGESFQPPPFRSSPTCSGPAHILRRWTGLWPRPAHKGSDRSVRDCTSDQNNSKMAFLPLPSPFKISSPPESILLSANTPAETLRRPSAFSPESEAHGL